MITLFYFSVHLGRRKQVTQDSPPRYLLCCYLVVTMASGFDDYPPFDPNEPLELHDPVPEHGELSGAYTAPIQYMPEIYPCDTCTRLMTTNFHLAAVVEQPGPFGPEYKEFYNPALNTFRQVNAMLLGDSFHNVGTTSARDAGDGGVLVVKHMCIRCCGFYMKNDLTHFINTEAPKNKYGLVPRATLRAQRKAANSGNNPEKELEVIQKAYETFTRKKRKVYEIDPRPLPTLDQVVFHLENIRNFKNSVDWVNKL